MKRTLPIGVHLATAISAGAFAVSVGLALIVSPWFVILAASAAFLPDLLRLSGALRDADEFQMEASGRASRLALVIGSFYMAVLYATTATGTVALESQREAWMIGFTMVLTARYIAYAMMFWDARRAAPMVFAVFGVFWLVFVVLSEWGDWGGLAIQALAVVGPFAAATILVRRFPRAVGIASVCLAVAACIFFGLHRVFLGDLSALTVFVLIPVPLATVGIGLIGGFRVNTEVEDD